MKNVAIIGGGILGLAIGFKLSCKEGEYKVSVFEKESEVGCHQSGKKGGSGVRAQALDPKGQLLMDFRVDKIGNQIHVLNAPSPGCYSFISNSEIYY